MKARYASYLVVLLMLALAACVQPIAVPEEGAETPAETSTETPMAEEAESDDATATPLPEEAAPDDATETPVASAGLDYTGPGAEVVPMVAEMAAQELGVDMEEIEVVEVEAVEWPDACLGVPGSDELCAQVITPGYRVVLSVDGTEHVYHTDESGSSIRPASES